MLERGTLAGLSLAECPVALMPPSLGRGHEHIAASPDLAPVAAHGHGLIAELDAPFGLAGEGQDVAERRTRHQLNLAIVETSAH